MITQHEKINLKDISSPHIVPCVQGDSGRSIVFDMADFTPPEDATATYYVQKPSGLAVYNTATIDGNSVLVDLTAESIAEVGDNYLQIRILDDDEVVTSFDCILAVAPFRGIDAIESGNESNIFDQAAAQALIDFETDAQEKAAETIATIPDDYTALSNSVTDLKNAYYDTNEYAITSWEQGYVRTDGTLGSSTVDVRTSSYIQFSQPSPTITVKTGWTIYIQEYNASKVSRSRIVNGNTGSFTLPIDVTYFYKFTIETVPSSTITPSSVPDDAVVITEHIPKIIDVEKDIADISENYNKKYRYDTWRNFLNIQRAIPTKIIKFKFTSDDDSVQTANIHVSGRNLLRDITSPISYENNGVRWEVDTNINVLAYGTPTGYNYIALGEFYAVEGVTYTVLCIDKSKEFPTKNVLFELGGAYTNSAVQNGVPFVSTGTGDVTFGIKRGQNGKPVYVNAKIVIVAGYSKGISAENYVGETSYSYNISNGTGLEDCQLYAGDNTITSDVPGRIEIEYYVSPYTQSNRNVLLSFITPSYSDGAGQQAYFPDDYALAVSYDGNNFCEINDTQYICKDYAVNADQFKGGNDTHILEHNGYYICVAQNYNSTTGAFADYVVTRDFVNFTPVRHFDGFDIAAYILSEFSHTITGGRVWEPSLFHAINGDIYIMASAQYKPDEAYPFETSVTNKFFVQVYGKVIFDEQTLELQASGSLSHFNFPSGVDTIIDVNIHPRTSDYIFCYKDETKLRSHVATLSALDGTPVNTLMSNLLGRSQIENPNMIDWGDFHLIYVTSYSPLLNMAQYVINGYGFGRAFAQICSVASPLIEKSDGRKCRSLHPIVINDDIIIDNINRLGHVIAPHSNDYRASATYTTLTNTFDVYYGLYIQLESARTYRIVSDITINVTNKWEDDTQPLRFITDGNSHTLTINGVSKTLPADNSVTLFDRLTNRFIN